MKPKAPFRSLLLMCGGGLIVSSVAHAQLTWDANGTGSGQTNGGGSWTGANLWWNGSANTNWVSGSDAIFGGTATAGGAVTLAAPTTVGAFTFNPSFSGTYTLGTSGQAITLNSGITKNANSAAVTFVSPMTLGGAQTWTNNSTTTLTTGNGTNLITNGGHQLTIDGTGNTTFGVVNNTAASLTGSGALIKNGTGVFTLSGTNAAFTGNVTVNAGVLRVTNPTSVTGNINLAGGVYEHYWSDAYTRSLGTGAGEIQITGGTSGFSENGNTAVTFTLNNNANFELQWGNALFNPSTFVLQADTAQQGSSFTLANKLDLNGTTRTIFVSGGTTGAARATISGQIRNTTGTAGFTKTGSGTLSLSNGANAWNGATTVSGGILDLGGMTNANLSGGSGRNVTVAAGAAIRFNALSNTFLNRIVETSDEITLMTGGTTNNLDFSSSTGANLPGAFLGNWASNGAKAEYSGTLTPATDNYRLGGKGSNGLLGIVGTNKLTGTQGLIVGGTGGTGIRVNVAAAQNFSGDTVITAGARLTVGHNLALQNSALNVGSAGGNFSLAAGTNAGRITGETAAPSPTFGGLIGSRNLITVFSATAGNNETNLLATGVTGFTLNVGTGKTLTYSGAIGGFGTGASGSTGGNSTLTKSGDGTQILSGTSTYTGATVVQQGTLLINGSTAAGSAFTVNSGATLGGTGTIGGIVTTSGTLSPGASIETLGSADLNFTTGATFAYETNSSAPVATGADLMKVTGNLSLSGTVALTLTDLASLATTFSPGTTFSLINYTGTWNGGLFSFGGNPLADDTIFNDGLTSWQISYNEAEGGQNYTGEYAGGTDSFVTITATAIPEPTAALLGLTALGLGLRRRR